VARLCPACGYGHFRSQRDADLCSSCGASLASAEEVKHLYRIENVSTKRAERITANEEERVRQGYEMQTTLQFAEADGRLQKSPPRSRTPQVRCLSCSTAPAATVWRMNFGWRRRKDKEVLGFMMNPVTGHWVGDVEDAGEENGDDTPPDRTPPQRIVPYVEDRRNILHDTTPPRTGRAVSNHAEHAAVRAQARHRVGVPARRERADGRTLADARQPAVHPVLRSRRGRRRRPDPFGDRTRALAAVAAEALELMHFQPPAEGRPWLKAALGEEMDDSGRPICEAGCYKCLLSYYNQPDHPLIDRLDKDAAGLVLDILCRLTQSQASLGTHGRTPGQHSAELARTAGSSLEQAWLAYVEQHGYRKPDCGQRSIASAQACADFYYDEYQLVVFIDGPQHEAERQQARDEATTQRLKDQGFLVVRFSRFIQEWPAVFTAHADLFGPSKND
jgi:very-short-patch-repair endonuclease